MARLPHVALLIESSREYGRGLLRGVARYHQEHGPWSIYFEPHGLNERPPSWLKHWHGDGILARIDNRRTADLIIATGLPAVDVRGSLDGLPIPFVGIDNRAIAELGFAHLQHCGVQNFAFCGTPRGENPNQDWRCDIFVACVKSMGKECPVCLGASRRRTTVSWEVEQQYIARWLKSLPKPVGVMTCHDDRGHQTLDACRRAGLRVPDDVAVIGVDNDSSLCNLCTPPLSSIDVNPSRVGFEAAALLMKLMRGAAAQSPGSARTSARHCSASIDRCFGPRRSGCRNGLAVRPRTCHGRNSRDRRHRKFQPFAEFDGAAI